MRILWLSNITLPELSIHLGQKAYFGGGWLSSLAKEIKNYVSLGIVSVAESERKVELNDITYYQVKSINSISWGKILEDFKPDIIHLHGTEYPYSLTAAENSGKTPIVVSIQGLVSIYSRFALGGLTSKEIISNLTLKDILKNSSPWAIQQSQKERGESERKLISKTKYIAGRTSWDKSHAVAINPNVKYFVCGEILRDSFYNGKWEYKKATPFTIFCCNSSVPLKGTHQIIEALPLIKKRFPNVTLRIAGKNVVGKLSMKERLKLSGYDNYLRNLISKLGLSDNITFLGHLNEEEMKREFLNCNVFVLGSSIENSPNSLGEAQLLGVPVIASYVGGTCDMMPDGLQDYLYRFEEIEMLSNKVCQIFEASQSWSHIQEFEITTASQRHSKEKVREQTLEMYKEIISRENKETI